MITEGGKTFRERIKTGAFQRSINQRDNIDFLLNHDTNIKLGSIKDGNLELCEDNIGLRISATVDNPEVLKSYEEGEFRGFSFGFISKSDDFRPWDNGTQLRTVKELDLIEVSLINEKQIPAYTGTMILNAERRSINDKPIEYRELIIGNITEDKDNDIEAKELESMRDYYNLMKYYIEKL